MWTDSRLFCWWFSHRQADVGAQRAAPAGRAKAIRTFFADFRRRKMWGVPQSVAAAMSLLMASGLFGQSKLGVGRPATEAEIKAWDISVDPEGVGLPDGGGTAAEGKQVYATRCAECHGENAEGGDEAALVGGQGTLNTPKPLKTAGSYWPYATTLWDYTNRSMPYDRPGMLTADQVYAVVAYILNLNGLIGENDRMDAKTLPQVKMPNRGGFVPDPRRIEQKSNKPGSPRNANPR